MRTVLIASMTLLVCETIRAEEPKGRVDGYSKPVLIARTAAHIYDINADGTRYLFSDGRQFGYFDRSVGKLIWQFDNTTIHDAKLSPDNKSIVAGEWQNGVNIYDAATGKRLQHIPAGDERPWQVHYLKDGTILYHTSWSSFNAKQPWTKKYSIIHYDPAKKKELGKVTGSVTYSSTNPWLWHRGAGFYMEHHEIDGLNTTTRRTVNYTDPITGKRTPTINLDVNDIPLDLSPDGKLLLVMTAGEEPRLVDTATGKTKVQLGKHKRDVVHAAYSPDGRLVATVSGTTMMDSTRGAYAQNSTHQRPRGGGDLARRDGQGSMARRVPHQGLRFHSCPLHPGCKVSRCVVPRGSRWPVTWTLRDRRAPVREDRRGDDHLPAR